MHAEGEQLPSRPGAALHHYHFDELITQLPMNGLASRIARDVVNFVRRGLGDRIALVYNRGRHGSR